MASLEPTMQARLHQVHERIERAARAAGRNGCAVALLAVSKTFDARTVLDAVSLGQRRFGENYLQEAAVKIARVAQAAPQERVEWHLIGPLQSNKTREAAELFDWVQSVDRLKIAQRLSQQRPPGRPALNVLLQVNISGEASKHGLPPGEAAQVARQVQALARLCLRGLMAIPEPTADPVRQRDAFAAMRRLFDAVRGELPRDRDQFDTLSMGMSDDLEAAVAEGSTMVRVGTAIFGQRQAADTRNL